MSASNTNKTTRLARLNQLIAGIQKYFMTLAAIQLGGKSYTPADLVTMLQGCIAAVQKASNSKAAYLADVQLERNANEQIAPVLRYLKAFVIAQFGDTQDSSQKLEDFGLTPRKVRPKNVQVKAQAAEKLVATRKARGTKGPKQRAKIKGTPPTEASTGSANGAPAPAASTAPAQVKPAS